MGLNPGYHLNFFLLYITLPRVTRVRILNIVVVLVLQMKKIYQPLTCQEAFVYHCKKVTIFNRVAVDRKQAKERRIRFNYYCINIYFLQYRSTQINDDCFLICKNVLNAAMINK